jgi:hypothetical protein
MAKLPPFDTTCSHTRGSNHGNITTNTITDALESQITSAKENRAWYVDGAGHEMLMDQSFESEGFLSIIDFLDPDLYGKQAKESEAHAHAKAARTRRKRPHRPSPLGCLEGAPGCAVPNLYVIHESMPRHLLEAAPSQRETVIG